MREAPVRRRRSRDMASLLARRGCVAVVGGCGLVAGQRFAFAEEGDGEGGGGAGTAPKAPGIYKDGGFDPAPIENVAKLLKETNGKLGALQHKKREELETMITSTLPLQHGVEGRHGRGSVPFRLCTWRLQQPRKPLAG